MTGKRVAVVTGSNQGIGLEIVKELCRKFDGVVYLTSRDENRGKTAVEELNKLGLRPNYHQLDIDEESSVLKLRNYLVENYGGLDVLVNNAAIATLIKKDDTLEDSIEKSRSILQTNFFSTYRVCEILFPLLRPYARVVNLSSVFGHLPRIDGQNEAAIALRKKFASLELSYEELVNMMNDFLEDVKKGDLVERGWPVIPTLYYNVSKIGVSVMSRLQQRDFDKDSRQDIIVNFVHPGYVITNMTVSNGLNQGMLTPEQGAVAPAWLALLPPNNPNNPKGEFLWHDKQIVDWVNGPAPAKY